jgi:tRNA pseudouridine38-40 synthase
MPHLPHSSNWCSAPDAGTPTGAGDATSEASDRQLPDSTRRLALVLEYDGTRYSGFQWQANAPTVQGEVEGAIRSLTGESVRVRGASRTDAGAHAKGQIVDFLTRSPHTTETFIKALNWHLPPDIRVRGAWDAGLDFNSRKDAISRVYRYTLLNARWQSALLRATSFWVRASLDIAAMSEAAEHLRGTHDFSALTVALPPGKSGIRRVYRWEVWREGETVLIETEGNSFLPHQVRKTNGLMVDIGRGRLPAEVMKKVVNGSAGGLDRLPLLPARGLCLMKVNYRGLPCG